MSFLQYKTRQRYQCGKKYIGRRIKTSSIRKNNRAGTARINACGDSRLRGQRSRKPIGFRLWVVHWIILKKPDNSLKDNIAQFHKLKMPTCFFKIQNRREILFFVFKKSLEFDSKLSKHIYYSIIHISISYKKRIEKFNSLLCRIQESTYNIHLTSFIS